MTNIDWFIFQKINSLASKIFWLDILAVFLADYFIYFIFLFACLFYFFLWFRKKKIPWQEVSIFVSILVLAFLIHFLITLFYSRLRPYISHPEVLRLTYPLRKFGSSLPSVHATLAFSLAFAIMLINRKMGWFFLASAFLIGLARVFVGVHWPFDILASFVVTFILSQLVIRFIFSKS